MILVISRFGFEGWIWVQIDSVPDLCILFTFNVRMRGTHKGGAFLNESDFNA